jgi:hypothetical protein
MLRLRKMETLVFSFGDASTHAGEFVFQHEWPVAGKLTTHYGVGQLH